MRLLPAVRAILLAAFILSSPLASADVDGKALMIDKIRAQQAQIRIGVEARTGVYKDLTARDRQELLARQTAMLALLEGKQSTQELSEDQRDEVFNTLEWIEATVNRAESERMICERRPVLGSNRKERVCKTAAQMQADRDAARERMDNRDVCSDCRAN